jgi:DNA-binding protein H-NS
MADLLKELLAQRATLDAEIARARKQESAAALTRIHELVAEFGFTAQQVFPWRPSEKKPIAPRYRDDKTGLTWSGRGKPPGWIAGKNRDDFLIERAQETKGPFLAQMASEAARRQQS